MAQALEQGYSVDKIHELSKITRWFLEGLKNIVDYANVLKGYNKIEDLPEDVLKEAKRLGFSDFQIARYVENPEGNMEKENIRVRNLRKKMGILPTVKRINTIHQTAAQIVHGNHFLSVFLQNAYCFVTTLQPGLNL